MGTLSTQDALIALAVVLLVLSAIAWVDREQPEPPEDTVDDEARRWLAEQEEKGEE